MIDRTGNLPPQPSIFSDYMASIVRNKAGGSELTMARWGEAVVTAELGEVDKGSIDVG